MSADVETREAIDLAKVPPRVRQLVERLSLNATVGTAGAQLDIMDQILSATTEEELFAAANAGTTSGQDVAGQAFLIKDWEYKRSAPGYVEKGAFPYYVLLRAQMVMDGRELVLNCGGFTVVSVIDGLDRLGKLSEAIAQKGGYPMVLEARQTTSGFDVLIPHPYAMPAPPTAA
jgi:hypothetical protein